VKKISIVISAYNEEGNVKRLYDELKLHLPGKYAYELLFVNDGSTDDTLTLLLELMLSDPDIKIVNLGKNFGHEVAMTAGMDYASGDCTIFMDADLQHPPHLIPLMLQKWEEGTDLVLTHRLKNNDMGWFDMILNKLFYRIVNFLSDKSIPPNMPDFRLVDAKYTSVLKSMREHNRLFRGLINWMSIKNHAVIDFEAPCRHAGKSKYNFSKLLALALDSIISFSIRPLRMASYFGILTAVVAVLMGIYFVFDFLTNPDYTFSGYGTTLVMVILMGSVQLFVLGIIGEYIGRIHIEIKKRPLYFAELIQKEKTPALFNPSESEIA
jgi:polyisoprenyl-phosphate glycosyltransferase